jgi:hypothetical protein
MLFFFFFFSIPFVTYSLAHSIVLLSTGYYYEDTYLVTIMNSIEVTVSASEIVVVRRKEGRRAKVGGMCVIADGKFQPSGISGEVTGKVTL